VRRISRGNQAVGNGKKASLATRFLSGESPASSAFQIAMRDDRPATFARGRLPRVTIRGRIKRWLRFYVLDHAQPKASRPIQVFWLPFCHDISRDLVFTVSALHQHSSEIERMSIFGRASPAGESRR